MAADAITRRRRNTGNMFSLPALLQARKLNRTLTFVLLLMTIIATVLVIRLSVYYESVCVHAAFVRSRVGVQNENWAESKLYQSPQVSGNSGGFMKSPRALSNVDTILLPDGKYDNIRRYHNRGLQLRRQHDCRKLFEGDETEQRRAIDFHRQANFSFTVTSSEVAPEMLKDCEAFKTIRGYRRDEGSPEEREFPMAYTLLVHKDFEHLERLLRMLYMPQHVFCIHVDAKAPGELQSAVAALANCFDNVRLASRPQDIVYQHISRLMADIVCMEDLLKMSKSWKYLINFAATEFPLRSNREVVKILSTFNGMNDIHESYKARIETRFNQEHLIIGGRMKPTKKLLPPAPHNITVTKGQAYNSFSRAFVEWVLKDKMAQDLLAWSNTTFSPDEHYWGTLNNLYHNPFLNTPGGFKGHPDRKGFITKFISWTYETARYQCKGKAVRHICVFGALDLPELLVPSHLGANKFDLTFDPLAYACMEELLENRTREHVPFQLSSYRHLYFLNYQEGDDTGDGSEGR